MTLPPSIGAGALVTVFLPHYNCERWLERAIRSILDQRFADLALVVADDASADPVALQEILRRCADPRLIAVRAERNVGPYQMFNRLLPLIGSPLVAFQDADDWSAPERLETLVTALEHDGWDILGSAIAREDEEGRQLEPQYPHRDANRALAWRCRGRVTFGATALCRTAFLRRLGGYDGRIVGKYGADTDLIYRAVFLGRAGNLADPLYHVMVRTNSLTTASASGFASPARRAYRTEIRRRFYRNFFRRKLGRLALTDLVAHPNELDGRLRLL